MHQFVSTTTRSVLSTTHPNLNRSAPSRRAVSYLPQQQTPRSTTCHAAAPSTTVGVDYDFACPICLTSRLAVTRYPNGTADTQLRCPCCQRTFANEGAYVDLTLTSGAPPRVYGQELSQQSVQLFRYALDVCFKTCNVVLGVFVFRREYLEMSTSSKCLYIIITITCNHHLSNPLVSFVYERGWRQGFASAGFPGADVEFDAAMAYLAPAQGGTLMDLSCGSGLFTRRFVKSSLFAQVIAADFSETMLQQTRQFISEDPAISPESYCLVRCDAARLPFASGSLDAVHAGAAIHCWPQPQVAVRGQRGVKNV